MAKTENPPFERGKTFYDGGTIDSNNLGGGQLIGRLFDFEDIDLSSTSQGAKAMRTNHPVRCMAVRNTSAGVLYAKRLVKLKKTAGRYLVEEVDGYGTVAADGPVFPVDEYVPTAGVPVNDIFYIVVEGPALTLTGLVGDATNVISVGDHLVCLTAATSGATTSGRIGPQDLSGSTTPLGNNIQNRVGLAMSAKTTANTNADLLVYVGRW